MIGPSHSAGAGRDALPRVRRCTSRRFFLLLLRTRSCALGAEVLAHQLNEVFAFLGRAMSDRAGARPTSANLMRGASMGECLLSRRDRLIVAWHEVPGAGVWTFREG